jgi:hypothetical protein
LALKNDITEHKYPDLPWPPTAENFTDDSYNAVIPPSLYNLLALMVGATEEIPQNDRFVEVQNRIHRKILSICEDIVCLNTKSQATPKHLSLGLTLKHLTGSARICNLINSYGHCASDDTIKRYSTALAMNRLQTSEQIPSGFGYNIPTTLVWDNNDFAEHTLTGANTSHHTNGILVQPFRSQHTSEQRTDLPKRPKSLQPVNIQIEPFYMNKKMGPSNLKSHEQLLNQCRQKSTATKLQDLAYIGIKSVGMDNGIPLPGWTEYNKQIQQLECLPKSAIHYLPVIESSPTELQTVNHILQESLKLADRLRLDAITVVFDQAIYSKAQQIRWQNPVLEKRLIVRMGEFHTVMCFLGVIGKRFKLSGLEDLLVEAQVVVVGSLNGVMSGSNYNRAIRAHKILFEALSVLQLQEFLQQLPLTKQENYANLLRNIYELYTTEQRVISQKLSQLQSEFAEYTRSKSESYPTYSLWNSYLDMVQILLSFTRATRESNWDLHLATLRQMLPWFFAYDRYNYAR